MYAFRFIAEAAAALVRLIDKMVRMLLAMIFSLFGKSPPALGRPLPALSTRADDVADEYKDAFTRELSNDHALASYVGMTVHRYASTADPYIRSAVDISGLSPDQQDWLLMLSDADLGKLATAGPKACELAVTGRGAVLSACMSPCIQKNPLP